MYLERNFPWTLKLSNMELSVLRKVFRDKDGKEEFTDEELRVADHLSSTIDRIANQLDDRRNHRNDSRRRNAIEDHSSDDGEVGDGDLAQPESEFQSA